MLSPLSSFCSCSVIDGSFHCRWLMTCCSLHAGYISFWHRMIFLPHVLCSVMDLVLAEVSEGLAWYCPRALLCWLQRGAHSCSIPLQSQRGGFLVESSQWIADTEAHLVTNQVYSRSSTYAPSTPHTGICYQHRRENVFPYLLEKVLYGH